MNSDNNSTQWLIGARHPQTGNRELDTVTASSKREALSLARAKWSGWFDVMARQEQASKSRKGMR